MTARPITPTAPVACLDLTFTATGQGRQAGIGETLKVPADAPVDVRLDVRVGGRLGLGHGGVADDRLTGGLRTRRGASPDAGRQPGQGNTMGEAPLFGPMAALTNPVFLVATPVPRN